MRLDHVQIDQALMNTGERLWDSPSEIVLIQNPDCKIKLITLPTMKLCRDTYLT